MRKIGIVPTASLFTTDSLYDDFYRFTDSYVQRICEAGACPVGVLPVKGRIGSEILRECDAFLIQGGSGIYGYHMDVMDHAVKTGKKVLGICLGCQTVHTYFAAEEEAEKLGWKESVADYYVTQRDRRRIFLDPVEGHRCATMPRFNTDSTKHKVLIEKGTRLYELFGKEEIMGASMHSFCITKPASCEVVSGRAEDGTIEAIEVGDKIIGTQFHPDVDEKLSELFDWLVK